MEIGINFSIHLNTHMRFGDDRYKKIREHGFSAVDFNLSNTALPPYGMPEDEAMAIIEKEKRLADEAGVSFFQLHGPWIWPPPKCSTEKERADLMEEMKFCIRAAKKLDCKYVINHPLMPYGHKDRGTGHEEETREINLNFFRDLMPYAKEYGITICYENMPMPRFSIDTPEEIAAIINEIDHENFKMCVDTGHVNIYPELSVGDTVRKYGHLIKAFHIHDNMGKDDEHLCPTKGTIDWEDFGNALREVGFDGVFSLEVRLPRDCSDEDFEKASIEAFTVSNKICNK